MSTANQSQQPKGQQSQASVAQPSTQQSQPQVSPKAAEITNKPVQNVQEGQKAQDHPINKSNVTDKNAELSANQTKEAKDNKSDQPSKEINKQNQPPQAGVQLGGTTKPAENDQKQQQGDQKKPEQGRPAEPLPAQSGDKQKQDQRKSGEKQNQGGQQQGQQKSADKQQDQQKSGGQQQSGSQPQSGGQQQDQQKSGDKHPTQQADKASQPDKSQSTVQKKDPAQPVDSSSKQSPPEGKKYETSEKSQDTNLANTDVAAQYGELASNLLGDHPAPAAEEKVNLGSTSVANHSNDPDVGMRAGFEVGVHVHQ